MKKGVSTMKKYPSYSEEFKQSIVNLYRNGKPTGEILKEYGMSSSVFYKWVRKYSVVQDLCKDAHELHMNCRSYLSMSARQRA